MVEFRSDLLKQVMESAPDAILVASESGSIIYANGQLRALFGYEAEDLAGRHLEELIPERFRARHRRHVAGYGAAPQLRPMGQSAMSLQGRRRDGSEFPVEIHLAPATEGGTTVVVATVRDITERQATARALHAARDVAEQVARAKGQFLATASHDLRQPLQSLRMLNASLRRLVTDPRVLEVVDAETANIDRMAILVEGLLNVARIESGTLRPEPRAVAIHELLRKLQAQFAPLARSRDLELIVEAPAGPALMSDPGLIEQLLTNLVSNAIKYTKRGRVTLTCEAGRDGVRIEVRDTGVGIPAEQLQSIFGDFVRLTGADRHADGFGLGLGIVRRLSVLLDLPVTVASQPGTGSVFAVHVGPDKLCAHDEPARPSLPAAAPAVLEPKGSRLMLLVDDDDGVRAATALFFELAGFDVRSAASADAALAAVPDLPRVPDLIITDNRLGPGLTGIELLPRLRAQLRRPVPGIVVTGDTGGAIMAGISDRRTRVMLKPVAPDELLRAAADLLNAGSVPS